MEDEKPGEAQTFELPADAVGIIQKPRHLPIPHPGKIIDESSAREEKEFQSTKNAKPWFDPNPNDPPPKQDWYPPARYYAREFISKDPTLIRKMEILSSMVADKLTEQQIFKRGGVKSLKASTVLKAFSNVNLK